MSEEREPVRLRDDPTENAELRAMLDAARGEHAPDAMLDRVLADILASGGGGGGMSGGGGAAVAKAVTTTVSLVVVGVLTVLVLGRVLVPDRAQLAHVDVDDAGPPDTGAPDTGLADAGPADAGAPDAGPRDAHVRRAALAPPPTLADPGPDDGALLLAATRARASDPARSLALALDHRARFPSSAAAEDREALVVLDLAALGRAAEARAAAAAFRVRWPRSTHQPHVDAALARLPAP